MSNYLEIKEAINKKELSISTLQNEMVMKQNRLNEICRSIDDLDAKQQREIERAKSIKLGELEEQSTKDIEKNITDIDQDILTVKRRYQSKSEKINKESFSSYYKSELELIDEVTDLSSQVYNTSKEILGDRLNQGIFNNLDKYEIDIDIGDLRSYVDRHDEVITQLEKLKKDRNFNFYKTIDKVLAKLNPCRDDEADNKKVNQSIILYLTLCGSLSFIALYYFSSVIFIGCLAIGFANIRRATKIRDLILDTKTLQDNVDDIRSTIDGYVEEDMEQQQKILDNEFDSVIKKLNSKRAIAESELQSTLKEVRDNFVFDDSTIRNSTELTKHSKNKEISDINDELDSDKQRLKVLVDERNELNNQLESAISSLKDELLSFNGDNYKFDNSYVLDVHGDNAVIWEHPKASCCMIWEGNEIEVNNFIRLFVAETISKFSPGLCQIDIWDTLNIGLSFMAFTKPSSLDSRLPGCCNIAINEEQVNSNLDELEIELSKRLSTIIKERSDIESYNELMKDPEIDGMLLPYKFLILDHFDLSLLSNSKLIRLLSQGSKLGVYPIIFLEQSQLMDLGKDSDSLIKNVERFYTIDGDNIKGKSKSKIREIIESE